MSTYVDSLSHELAREPSTKAIATINSPFPILSHGNPKSVRSLDQTEALREVGEAARSLLLEWIKLRGGNGYSEVHRLYVDCKVRSSLRGGYDDLKNEEHLPDPRPNHTVRSGQLAGIVQPMLIVMRVERHVYGHGRHIFHCHP